MTHTRTLTGTIHKPTGDPWPAFKLDFALTPTAHMSHATLPATVASVTTGEDGTFSVALETGVQYEARLAGAYLTQGFSTTYPPGTRFKFVLPDGATPISLEEVVALNAPPDGSGSFASAVADHETRIDALESGPYVPSMRPGYVLSPVAQWGGFTSVTQLGNNLTGVPIWIPPDGITVAKVSITAGGATAASSARLGLYHCDQLTGRPAGLLDEWTDEADVNLATNGTKSIDLSASPPHYTRDGDAFPILWLTTLLSANRIVDSLLAVNAISPLLGASFGFTDISMALLSFASYGPLPATFGDAFAWASAPNISLTLA